MTVEELEKKVIAASLNGNYDYLYALVAVVVVEQTDTMALDPDRFRPYYLTNPELAYWFAREVDKGPRDDTREACCKDPNYSHSYATNIDKCPHDLTRKAACLKVETAFNYALYVDNGFHKETLTAVIDNDYYFKRYLDAILIHEIDYDDLRAIVRKKYL